MTTWTSDMISNSWRRPARALGAVGLAAASLGLPGAAASARVTVDPAAAVQGGEATLEFKVSTERASAGTTRLEIDFPADHPLSEVSTQPRIGWDVAVERVPVATASPTPSSAPGAAPATDRVARVTWTASTESAQIGPDQFDVFSISVGPLPTDTDALVFKALQTYSDGEVVSWVDEAVQGSATAPARPAPVLRLTAAPAARAVTTQADAVASSTPTSAGGAPAAEPVPTTLDVEKVAAASAAGDDGKAARVTLGLAVGTTLILAGVGGAAVARRRGGENAAPPGT